MNYQIVYPFGERISYHSNAKKRKKWTVVILACCVLSISAVYKTTLKTYRNIPDRDKHAVQTLLNDLSGNKPVKDAITDFCREIIADAEISG